MMLRWFMSRTVRQAHHVCRHVQKLVNLQRDILSADATAGIESDIRAVRETCAKGSKSDIQQSLTVLEKTANKWLKPYPHAAWRENVEVMLVAIAVAMGIRTFFLQPFKIPTGSMQPTLYGVTQEDLRGRSDVQIPNRFASFFEYWFNGVQYFHVVAKSDGELTYDPPSKFVLFNLTQNYRINGRPQGKIWFPPDELFARGGVRPGDRVRAGQDIVKLRVISGDHLFVDRVTFNFRRPARGDIVVFETHGITELARMHPDQQDTYYIKRLCGIGPERLSLKPDYEVAHPYYGPSMVGHLVVNREREITAATPPFENLYSYPDAKARERTLPYLENHYYGHWLKGNLSEGMELNIPDKQYFVMGDNTFNSSDSRYWGNFDRERVIGKSFFVYWPIGSARFKGEIRQSRFGWSHR